MKTERKTSTKVPLNRTMSQELMLSFGLVFLCFGILIGVVLFLMIKGALYQEKENLLESRVHNIPIESLLRIETDKELFDNANIFMNEVVDLKVQCAIIASNGEIIAKVGNNNLAIFKDRLLVDEQPYLENLNDLPVFAKEFYQLTMSQKGFAEVQLSKNSNGIPYMSFFLKTGDLNKSSGMIQMSTDLSDVNGIIRKQMFIYALLSISMLIIALIVIWNVTRRTLLPLKKMQEIISKFKLNLETKELEKNAHLFKDQEELKLLKGQAEIVTLAKSYDEMLTALQNAFERENIIKQQMRQFVSDASHELRTPLTSIHGFAETLELGAYSNPEDLIKGLKVIMSESERMETLVSNLLTLNRLDQNRLNRQESQELFEKIKLDVLLEEMAPQLKILAKKRLMKWELDQNTVIRGQSNGLRQVILNLCQNAIQHTSPEEGIITISTSRFDDKVELCISDNGKGIQPEAIAKIFDRFYRGEIHRSREEGGYGLGLAIVKSIVELYQGSISVESAIGKGTTFNLIFPYDN